MASLGTVLFGIFHRQSAAKQAQKVDSMSFLQILGTLLPLIQGRVAAMAPQIETFLLNLAPLIAQFASGAQTISTGQRVSEFGHTYEVTLVKVS
jgi:hypothetical protein